MAEYIERRRLFNALADYWNIPHDWDGGIAQPCEDALTFIEDAPEEDVVPVVRCKDCEHRGDHEVCPLHDIRLCFDGDGHMDEVEDDKTEDEFFCSYGKRREDT